MDAAARLNEHRHVGIVNAEAGGPHLGIELTRAQRRQHAIIAESDDIAAKRHGLAEA